ncbi:hypothetical protein QBC46DRAFT_365606 [Diplogelasinospora grovesii]|uniref:2EXR domain-containing protein n=1 Tax=Diplogelasinospora grovesii TaxID=303347 RepID=A0AAN6N3S1_9PEZI|nr:hypothetical protein QBC46DRAFT_365606 [Diplogelasinospora grovesii]
MTLTSSIFRLPFELRMEIWELAATAPRVIDICVEGTAVTTCTKPHPLLHVCHESRTIYLEQNGDKLQVQNSEARLAVNFGRDFFAVRSTTGDWPTRTFPSEHPLRQLERVIVDLRTTCYMSFLVSKFSQIQELRVFLEDIPKQLHLTPASEFRHHCPLHRDDISPRDYYQQCDRQSGVPCPTCLWAEGFWNFGFPYSPFWGDFRVTLDSSLPKFPTVEQILHTRNPLVRCVKTGTRKSFTGTIQALRDLAAAFLIENR